MSKDNTKEKILEKINLGEVRMRPRLYFVTRLATIVILVVVFLITSLLILSFVIFSIHEGGERFLLGFGGRGLLTFLTLFPWAAVLVAIVFLIILEMLLRRFKFGYRLPIINIFIVILIVSVLGSMAINFTPLHSFLLKMAEKDSLPIVGPFYEQIHNSRGAYGIFRGNITNISSDRIVISHNDTDLDEDDGTWTVLPPYGFDINSLHLGQKVYVAGDAGSSTIQAYGIRGF